MPDLTAEALSLLSDIAAAGTVTRYVLSPLWTRDTCEGAYIDPEEGVSVDDVDALRGAGLLEWTGTDRASAEYVEETFCVSAAGGKALGEKLAA